MLLLALFGDEYFSLFVELNLLYFVTPSWKTKWTQVRIASRCGVFRYIPFSLILPTLPPAGIVIYQEVILLTGLMIKGGGE